MYFLEELLQTNSLQDALPPFFLPTSKNNGNILQIFLVLIRGFPTITIFAALSSDVKKTETADFLVLIRGFPTITIFEGDNFKSDEP